MGYFEWRRGNANRATLLLQESLALNHDLRHRRGIADSLELLADISNAQHHAYRAASLYGAADALRAAHEGRRTLVQIDPAQRAAVADALAALLPGFHTAWEEGHCMSLEKAVAYALLADEHSQVSRPVTR
jgi:hypothetical protein